MLVVRTGKLKLRPSSENIHLLYIDSEIEKVYHRSTKMEDIDAFRINCFLRSSCVSGRDVEVCGLKSGDGLEEEDEPDRRTSAASVELSASEDSLYSRVMVDVDDFRCILTV